MATIIRKNGEVIISIGGEVSGQIVVNDDVVVQKDVKKQPISPEILALIDELEAETFRIKKHGGAQEWLAVEGNRNRLESIKDSSRANYEDFRERLGLAEPEKDEADTGAVATRGQVRAGKGGIVVPGNFKGNIVMGENNKFK